MSTATATRRKTISTMSPRVQALWLLVWIGLFLALPTRGFTHPSAWFYVALACVPTVAWWRLLIVPFHSEEWDAAFAIFLHSIVWLSPFYAYWFFIVLPMTRG